MVLHECFEVTLKGQGQDTELFRGADKQEPKWRTRINFY